MLKPHKTFDKIKVTPLASESFGVRSMCTMVETPDVSVLLDAGVSLCPYRFNLPPHPIEFRTIQKLREKIAKAADKAQVVTISHYHYDHHTPSFEDWVVNWTEQTQTARQIYQGKEVLVKHSKEKINASQRQRAWMFQKAGGKYAKLLSHADGKTFTYGGTKLIFSEPVAHGENNSMLGYVVMVTIECEGERFMFAPDVQGPMAEHTLQLILSTEPSLLMIGGPPFYLAGFRVNESALQHAVNNLSKIIEVVPTLILEHHALRDLFYEQKISVLREQAVNIGHKVLNAAEYVGDENLFLESRRKQLFRDFPPSEEFKQWMKTLNNKVISKPPL
jgi:predicted metallo-beta-lactamase superfamily hydrolase